MWPHHKRIHLLLTPQVIGSGHWGWGTLTGKETLPAKELVLWVQVGEASPWGGVLRKGPPQEHPASQLASGAHLRRAQTGRERSRGPDWPRAEQRPREQQRK